MAHHDEGWPLGLRPLNARVGLVRSRDFSAGSVSFSTLVTGSPTSSMASSSDESSGSLFHDKNMTLGSLIGVSGIFDLSRRSSRRSRPQTSIHKNNPKPKPWLCSLFPKLTRDSLNATNNTPSLGHFLEAERRASNNNNIDGRNRGGMIECMPDDVPVSDPDMVLVDGGARSNRGLLEYGNGFGAPLVFSCLCGQLIK